MPFADMGAFLYPVPLKHLRHGNRSLLGAQLCSLRLAAAFPALRPLGCQSGSAKDALEENRPVRVKIGKAISVGKAYAILGVSKIL